MIYVNQPQLGLVIFICLYTYPFRGVLRYYISRLMTASCCCCRIRSSYPIPISSLYLIFPLPSGDQEGFLNRFCIKCSLPYFLFLLATLLTSLSFRVLYNNIIFRYKSVPTTRYYTGIALQVIFSFFYFTCPLYYYITIGLALGVYRNSAFFIPIL